MIAEQVSHYGIISKLGASGMGEVYLAEDTQLGRRVAIKLLPAKTIPDDHARKRLVREARAVATLDHGEVEGAMGALLGTGIDSSMNYKEEEAWH